MAEAYRDTTYSVYELRDLRDPKALGAKLREDPTASRCRTPKAHLKAWLKFTDYDEWRAKAIDGASKLDHRTGEAAEILANDEFRSRVVLENLARLDLEATPAICARPRSATCTSSSIPPSTGCRKPTPTAFATSLAGSAAASSFSIDLAGIARCDARAEVEQAIDLYQRLWHGADGGLTSAASKRCASKSSTVSARRVSIARSC